MTHLLITPNEVLELAFSSGEHFAEEMITPVHIICAQQKYLKPALGAFYDELKMPLYRTFVHDFLKMPLAYYVRSLALAHFSAQVGPMGVMVGKTDYATSASARREHALRKSARMQANTLLKEALVHIESHPLLFPAYNPAENIHRRLSLMGNIAL